MQMIEGGNPKRNRPESYFSERPEPVDTAETTEKESERELKMSKQPFLPSTKWSKTYGSITKLQINLCPSKAEISDWRPTLQR